MENKIRVEFEWPGNGTFDGLVGERLGVDGKRQLASLGLSSMQCILPVEFASHIRTPNQKISPVL